MLFKRPSFGIDFILVGLGNPGKQYALTRHNAGFWALDSFAKENGCSVLQSRFHALCGKDLSDGTKVLLLKPLTYMNLSGSSVEAAASYYKLSSSRILVLCDDITLAPGSIRIRQRGSSGGHNGLQSIIEHLQNDDFPRIRIGVGDRPNNQMELSSWVTGMPSSADKRLVEHRMKDICSAIRLIISGELALAQSRYNGT